MTSNTKKDSKSEEYPRSKVNPKYREMVGEFVYKGVPWVSWTTLERIQRVEQDFQFFHDDTIIATYPKSGTTLLQEMVWLLCNNVDLTVSKQVPVYARVPFIEENYTTVFPGNVTTPQYPIDYLPHMPAPRLIKTHLPYRHLKHHIDRFSTLKVIVCLRNPKDTAVSYYHFYKGTEDYGPFGGDWNEFFKMWMDGWITAGDWLDVVGEWCNVIRQDSDNQFLLVHYEDLVKKPRDSLEKIASFLNIDRGFDSDKWNTKMETIVRETKFDVMRNNPMTNYSGVISFASDFRFMRLGQVGDWRRWFTIDQNRQFDQIYNKRLAEMGLEFDFGSDKDN